MQSTIDILEKLVAFDTTSRNSNLELISYVSDYLGGYGVTSELIYNEDRTKANLLARIGPEAHGGVLLSGHTDVVPVDGQEWHTPPFILTEKDGILYGRGTADMKSFLASCLSLVPEWTSRKLSTPIYLAFSYDEEIGCLGAPSLAAFIKEQKLTPELAIIGEPTMMQIAGAHKGIRSFETVVSGLEAHSSNPERGVNAVMIASELVHFLGEMAKQHATGSDRDERFEPAYTTIHVGVMHGGTARNIIPRECRFAWEIRPLPSTNPEVIIERFQKKCDELQTVMQKTSQHTAIVTRPISQVAGLTHSHQHEDNKLMQLLDTNQIHSVSYCTEAGIFQQAGLNALIIGPGSIEQAHKPNEFIAVEQINVCVDFLRKLTAN